MTVLSTIREDPPPPRWFTALFQGQTHDWQRVKTPRVDALCCATPSFHLTGTGDRQEIMLSLHPLFFFFPFAALTMENTADVFPLCMQSDVSGPVFYRQRGERLQPHCRNTSVGDGCVFRLVVPLSQPQRKPEHGPTTREEEKRSLLGCHSCVYIVMCSESGACYDHIAGENIQFIPQRLLLQSKCWSRSISSSSTLVEMKISSQLSDRLLWSSVQTFDRERLALVLVNPSTFLHASPQLLSCLLWNVLQCFNSWPNTYRNPIQSSWMNKCWDMFVSSCWDFNLTLCRCADGPALFRQQNPLYSVKRSFSLLGSVATNKAKIED